MDNIQDFIYTNLPSSLLGTLTTHTKTYYRIYSALAQARNVVISTLNRIFNPLLTRLLHEPDIVSFLLLIIVLFLSMKVLDFVWRTMLFWARFFLRMVIFAALVGLGVWVWSRGFEGWFNDLRWIGQVWWDEYEGWKRRAELASMKQKVGDQVMGGRGRKGWR